MSRAMEAAGATRRAWLGAAAALAVAPLLPARAVAAATGHPLKHWEGESPELALKDLDGRLHELRGYRGKVVVVNFWATWCEPCRDELPSLRKLRQRLRDRPFEVLAVNFGEGEARIREFLEKMPLDFPVLLDRDSVTTRPWRVRALPATYVVAADGRVRYFYLGELDWASEPIAEAVRALLPAGR